MELRTRTSRLYWHFQVTVPENYYMIVTTATGVPELYVSGDSVNKYLSMIHQSTNRIDEMQYLVANKRIANTNYLVSIQYQYTNDSMVAAKLFKPATPVDLGFSTEFYKGIDELINNSRDVEALDYTYVNNYITDLAKGIAKRYFVELKDIKIKEL